MAIPRRARVVGAIALSTVLVLVWFLRWRSVESQVPALFARLQAAVESGSASATLALLHPDYDVRGHWSGFDEFPGEPRTVAQQALTVLYRMHREDPLRLDWSVQRVTPRPDGTLEVRASIIVNAQRGPLAVGLAPIEHHRFLLARAGWLGRFAILDHDPIDVTR